MEEKRRLRQRLRPAWDALGRIDEVRGRAEVVVIGGTLAVGAAAFVAGLLVGVLGPVGAALVAVGVVLMVTSAVLLHWWTREARRRRTDKPIQSRSEPSSPLGGVSGSPRRVITADPEMAHAYADEGPQDNVGLKEAIQARLSDSPPPKVQTVFPPGSPDPMPSPVVKQDPGADDHRNFESERDIVREDLDAACQALRALDLSPDETEPLTVEAKKVAEAARLATVAAEEHDKHWHAPLAEETGPTTGVFGTLAMLGMVGAPETQWARIRRTIPVQRPEWRQLRVWRCEYWLHRLKQREKK